MDNWSVTLALPDGERTFAMKDGSVLANYAGAHVRQRNIVCHDSNIPLTVFFRPDAGPTKTSKPRMEIVVEWGDVFTTGAMSDLSAYGATIKNGDTVVATVSVSAHYWLTRWRWQSAPRPVISNPHNIVKAGLLPKFHTLNAQMALPPLAPGYAGPMGTSNICKDMGTTGDRFDIGLLTEYGAAYMATGDAGMLASVLAWAECSGSIGWHIRDKNTNAPINWETYPNANCYGDNRYSNPVLQVAQWPQWLSANPVRISGNHVPSLTYLAFLLTDDPYYLEELQFQGAWHVAEFPGGGPKIFPQGESRDWAWNFRDTADAYLSTPDNAPSWLLPKDYWKRCLDANLAFVTADFLNAPANKQEIFGSGMDPNRIIFWEEDYEALAIGAKIAAGLSDWRPVLEWKLKSNLGRCSDTSGWPKQMASQYSTNFQNQDGSACASWSDLWAMNAVDLPPDGSLWYSAGGGTTYQEIARGVASLSSHLKVEGMDAVFAYLDPAVQSLCQKYEAMSYRWSL